MRDSLSTEPPAAPGVGRLGLRPLPPNESVVTIRLTERQAERLEMLLDICGRRMAARCWAESAREIHDVVRAARMTLKEAAA